MIIDANIPINGKTPLDWSVYHSLRMKFMFNVVRVNDENNQYEVKRNLNGMMVITTYQADKILIMPPIKLIVINPVIDNHLFYDSFRIMMQLKPKQ